MLFQLETKDSPFIFQNTTGLGPIPHLHTHIELVYFINGSTRCVADDKEAMAEAGDVFLALPNQIHHYHDIEHPKVNLLIFSVEVCPDLSKELRSKTALCPVIKRADLPSGMEKRFREIEKCHHSASVYSEAKLKAMMTLLMCDLLSVMPMENVKGGYDGNILKKAVTYCYDNFHSDVSLERAESELGISRYYLSHLFKDKLNIGFKEYVNSLRVRAACEMLKNTDKSITEIAYDVGFGTTRTFNRCFISARSVSPKDYRNSHKKQ